MPQTESMHLVDAAMVSLHPPLANHPALAYLSRLGKRSQRVMAESLNAVCDVTGVSDMAGYSSTSPRRYELFPWAGLRIAQTRAIRAALIEATSARTGSPLSPATVNRHLAALKGVLKEAFLLNLMTAEDYQRAINLPPVNHQSLLRGRALQSTETAALFRVCRADSSIAGQRDAALLAVLYGAGLRRAEAVALTLSDYDAADGGFRIQHGKGNKAREVWLSQGGQSLMMAWLQTRGTNSGPVFVPINRWGTVYWRHLTDQAVLEITRRRAREAAIEGFSPHDLRRTFISDLLDAGADISTVQQMAGHANIATTSRYDRRGNDRKRRAAELLHVPSLADLCAESS